MNSRIIIFILSVIIFLGTLGRFFYTKSFKNKKNGYKQEITAVPSTTAKFPETIKNKGVGKVRVPVFADFVVYNTGTQDLIIQKIEPDCHCTSTNCTKAKVIPNDSAVIRLMYDAENEGPYQSTAVVTTNTEPRSTLLILRGTIKLN